MSALAVIGVPLARVIFFGPVEKWREMKPFFVPAASLASWYPGAPSVEHQPAFSADFKLWADLPILVTHVDQLMSQFMRDRTTAVSALLAQGNDAPDATGNPGFEQIGRQG